MQCIPTVVSNVALSFRDVACFIYGNVARVNQATKLLKHTTDLAKGLLPPVTTSALGAYPCNKAVAYMLLYGVA